MGKLKTKKEVIRVDGKLKEIVTVHDEKGKILHKLISPLKVEFNFKDLLQVMVGASILAIPVGFTEETWNLGRNLPNLNVIILVILSILFVSAFTYYHYYKEKLKKHRAEFIKRVLVTYLVSFLVVAVLLTLIEIVPWTMNMTLALKRTAIVTFPASMSAAVADTIK